VGASGSGKPIFTAADQFGLMAPPGREVVYKMKIQDLDPDGGMVVPSTTRTPRTCRK